MNSRKDNAPPTFDVRVETAQIANQRAAWGAKTHVYSAISDRLVVRSISQTPPTTMAAAEPPRMNSAG